MSHRNNVSSPTFAQPEEQCDSDHCLDFKGGFVLKFKSNPVTHEITSVTIASYTINPDLDSFGKLRKLCKKLQPLVCSDNNEESKAYLDENIAELKKLSMEVYLKLADRAARFVDSGTEVDVFQTDAREAMDDLLEDTVFASKNLSELTVKTPEHDIRVHIQQYIPPSIIGNLEIFVNGTHIALLKAGPARVMLEHLLTTVYGKNTRKQAYEYLDDKDRFVERRICELTEYLWNKHYQKEVDGSRQVKPLSFDPTRESHVYQNLAKQYAETLSTPVTDKENVNSQDVNTSVFAVTAVVTSDSPFGGLRNFQFHFNEEAGEALSTLTWDPCIRVRKAMIGWIVEYKKPD